ncbi:MAG: hypothetical protein M1817_006454 [Caeruleum heppii]|nr:MAG: hypothetical protein M1817_006454 [Caeruleum heppii]
MFLGWTISTACLVHCASAIPQVFTPPRPLHGVERPPEAGITCLGPLPAFMKPHLDAGRFQVDYSNFTLQELCAAPSSGGRGPRLHLGGYCAVDSNAPQPWRVKFDLTLQSLIADELKNPRMLYYCRSRCFCHDGLTDRTVQPLRTPDLDTTFVTTANAAYQIGIDVLDDFTVPADHHRGRGYASVDVIQVGVTEDVVPSTDPTARPVSPFAQITGDFNELYVSIDPRNRVTCEGELPFWDVPGARSPITPRGGMFRDLQQFCAVQLSGGHQDANAGAYCHRDRMAPDVWFTDDMTPRLEWTWSRNFAASAAIRYWCWQRCWCASGARPANRPMGRFFMELVPHFMLTGLHDGSIAVVRDPSEPGSSSSTACYWDADGGPSEEGATLSDAGAGPANSSACQWEAEILLRVLPPGPLNASHPAGTCGPDGRQFCPTPWPRMALGPNIPVTPPSTWGGPSPGGSGSQSNSAPSSAGATMPQRDKGKWPALCGNRCRSNTDCGGSLQSTGCRCVAASLTEVRRLGLDPVFPQALCLLVMQSASQQLPGGRGRLTRRSVEDMRSLNGSARWACACNATYVSEACCHSDEGLVWESGDKKLGRLDLEQ